MFDNIAAIATPYGSGAISVIRTSGPNCITLVQKVFSGKLKDKGYTISYGNIMNVEGIVDEVLISTFRAPHSFDGEDCCEISCHGGIFVTNLVLETLLNNGFRLAEPGEFSKRAYLNHKIDLTQSEAIMDIIAATNKKALKSAENSLHRFTRKMIQELREKILTMLASIEVNIDYPEYEDAMVINHEILKPQINSLLNEMNEILKNSNMGRVVREGIKVAIIGKPNVGKSSLLNLLLDEEKAIVTDIAGTTRDTVDGYLALQNITIHFIDTAGIRDSDDVVEKIGIERSLKAMEEADIIFLVFDSSRPLDEYDEELLEKTNDKKRILIYNKTDLMPSFSKMEGMIGISTADRQGLKELEMKVEGLTRVGDFNVNDANYLSNTRHISLMKQALVSLNNALQGCDSQLDSSFIEIDLKESFDLLGDITGEAYDDELIDSLFSKFCLGK